MDLPEAKALLKDAYRRYRNDTNADADRALEAAGLPPIGVNWLSPSARLVHIDSIEEFAAAYIAALNKDADLGVRFRAGRKVGTVGPIRNAITKHLRKHPKAKNPDIWDALCRKPPKDWAFYDNPIGKYIERPKMKSTSYDRFCTICGEERKKITV
jgi:hypothetical protein